MRFDAAIKAKIHVPCISTIEAIMIVLTDTDAFSEADIARIRTFLLTQNRAKLSLPIKNLLDMLGEARQSSTPDEGFMRLLTENAFALQM